MYDQSDFESPSFDENVFIDQLIEKAEAYSVKREFDSNRLYSVFSQTIIDLEDLSSRMNNNLNKLQLLADKEIRDQKVRIEKLKQNHEQCSDNFHKLDAEVSEISKRLVLLGDQLENISSPHWRTSEAKKLITSFNSFMQQPMPRAELEDRNKYEQNVDLLVKLNEVLGELDESKFQSATIHIRSAYEALEEILLSEFRSAYNSVSQAEEAAEPDARAGEEAMARYARLLMRFRRGNECINIFIEDSLSHRFEQDDTFFDDVIALSQDVKNSVQRIFANPELVMSTYYTQVFNNYVAKHVQKCIGEVSGDFLTRAQLGMLLKVYNKCQCTCTTLVEKNLTSDAALLQKLTRKVFADYLKNYQANEEMCLKQFCDEILTNFYQSRNHVKRVGGSHKSEFFSKKSVSENFDGTTLLLDEEVTQILSESESAIQRCRHFLYRPLEKSELGLMMFKVVLKTLLEENVKYAAQYSADAIHTSEPRTEPVCHFFKVMSRANSLVLHFEKLYKEHLLTLLITSSAHVAQCEELKAVLLDHIQAVFNVGIDRALTLHVNWIKRLYTTHQRVQDYQTAADDSQMGGATDACLAVCDYVLYTLEDMRACVDRRNLQLVLTEYGVRFHSALLQRLQKLQFSLYGGIQISMDLSEYKKTAEKFGIPLIMSLFNSLQALCNLLITPSESLSAVVNGPELVSFEQDVIHMFVRLRTDYRSADLGKLFHGQSQPTQ